MKRGPRDEMEEMGFIRPTSPEERKQMGRLDPLDGWDYWLAQIEQRLPSALTDDGRRFLSEGRAANAKIAAEFQRDERRTYEEANQIGEFTQELKGLDRIITPREDGDEDATDRQLHLLNLLGARNPEILAGLGKGQAGRLIDKIKELRGDT